MTEAHKQEVLRHCLWLATLDPDYAIDAAGWYERNEPWLLANLQAKVRQEVARRDREVPSLNGEQHERA